MDELHRFFGILLRTSLQPVDFGGYTAYFKDDDTVISLSDTGDDDIEILGTAGFVSWMKPELRMSLNRFKQIRGAFHPEDKDAANGSADKCFQLRRAINELNAASNKNFVPEANCAFDEGGIACRSRYCPVRQYNKDKPDKFRVDFFILAGSTTFLIYHIDVYQGKNAANIGIFEPAINLPTTMKAVVNAVVMSNLGDGSDEENGYRVISLDNRYQCPQLAFLLMARYHIMLVGTCRQNRIGWPKEVMNMDKKVPRGSFKVAYCDKAKLAAFQWCDSKVVNCVSSLLDFRIGQVQRQIGRNKQQFSCPAAMMHYQRNMGGVDRADQIRSHFGGFAAASHFKKWYKKSLMAVLDCMLINALRTWNMSVAKVPGRQKLERYEFMQIVAHELLQYKTGSLVSPVSSPNNSRNNTRPNQGERNQVQHEVVETNGERRCLVCRFEHSHLDSKRKELTGRQKEIAEQKFREAGTGLRKNVALCRTCGIVAHNFIMEKNAKIIHEWFPGRTCMEIFHSEVGKKIWTVRGSGKKKCSVHVNTTHELVESIRKTLDASLNNV